MLRKLFQIPTRGIKHQVNVKWVRPPYVPAYHPEKSGDLGEVPEISDSTLVQAYALSEEIENAPESVRKLFSVGFLGKKEYNTLLKQEFMDKVKLHQYDEGSEEARIARLTAIIRYLQVTMQKSPRNNTVKVALQQIIDKRKKLLKLLRQCDYKKFEWLLEKLNIEYKAHPECHNKLSRKQSLRKLTEMYCDDLKNKKLNDYKNLLESQQIPYLKEKLENLNFIRNEQIELKLAITVSEQDITKVEKQLQECIVREDIKLEAKKKKRNIITELEE